jgi:hypothetical protein
MTAKRGTQWKTSWRRQKPALGGGPFGLWFFNGFRDLNGEIWYQQALSTPTVGDTTDQSFWIGSIQSAIAGSLQRVLLRGTSIFTNDWYETLETNLAGVPLTADVLVNSKLLLAPVTPLNENPPAIVRAVVMMLAVRTTPISRVQELWVDGQLVASASAPHYVAHPAYFGMARPGSLGLLNSWAGGNAEPTLAEIRAWFSATRNALAAQPIPGKTLDRFDAGAVPGIVPPVLANLDVGQAMTSMSQGTSPAFANTLFQAVFGY